MVAPWVGFLGDTRSGVFWCHPLSFDASAAVTDLVENYVQMRTETKKKWSPPQISGVFGRIMVSHHKMVTPGQAAPPPPPSNASEH